MRRLIVACVLSLLSPALALADCTYWIRYGTQTNIPFYIIKRNSADFAVSADWTPADPGTSDCRISKDFAAEADCTNLPSAPASTTAKWKWTITATEAEAAVIQMTIIDAATKAVEDAGCTLLTYGHASAFLPNIPGPAVGASGGVIVAGTGANQISPDGAGNVPGDVQKWRGGTPDALIAGLPPVHAAELGVEAKTATNLFRRNVQALYLFRMVDATDLHTPETGLSPTCVISRDGASAASATTNSPSEISAANFPGDYQLTLTAADLNYTTLLIRCTGTGAAPWVQQIYTQQ